LRPSGISVEPFESCGVTCQSPDSLFRSGTQSLRTRKIVFRVQAQRRKRVLAVTTGLHDFASVVPFRDCRTGSNLGSGCGTHQRGCTNAGNGRLGSHTRDSRTRSARFCRLRKLASERSRGRRNVMEQMKGSSIVNGGPIATNIGRFWPKRRSELPYRQSRCILVYGHDEIRQWQYFAAKCVLQTQPHHRGRSSSRR